MLDIDDIPVTDDNGRASEPSSLAQSKSKWPHAGVARAKKRCLIPPPCRNTLIERSISAAWPWEVAEYPGYRRMLMEICGVSENCVGKWLYQRQAFPAQRARLLRAHLEGTRIKLAAAIDELTDYIARREQAVPHPGNRFRPGCDPRRSGLTFEQARLAGTPSPADRRASPGRAADLASLAGRANRLPD